MKDNTKSRDRGNTLSLIVTCALVIVLIGLGFDFLLMIFKGHRRLTNSTDAIALDMAKNFIRAPKVRLTPGFETENWGPLSDNGWVDLYRFNKIVSQTILSAANALADGSPDALQAANELIAHLQAPATGAVTSKSSLAERLRVELEKAAKDFSDGNTFDINISSAEPTSLFQPANAGGPNGGGIGNANASSTGIDRSKGYAYGHPGGCGQQGEKGSKKDSNGSGSNKGSNAGRNGTGNGGWNDGRSWTDKFGAAVPQPGTTKYQSFAGGTPSAEKQVVLGNTDYVAWVDRAGPSNIAINPVALPFLANTNVRVQIANGTLDVNGKAYLPGYTELTFGNGDKSKLSVMAAIPMRVNDQPHLISTRVFEDNKTKNFIKAAVPPNAFKFVGSTVDSQGKENISAAAAQACSGNFSITAAFDFGYIEVINRGDRGGYDYDGKNGGGMTTTNVYSKELMSGIYLADSGAFSTKQSALQEWVDYNNGKTKTPPNNRDAEGNFIVHGDTSKIRAMDATRGGSFPCQWMHVTHGNPIDNYDPKCGEKLKEFEKNYPEGQVVAGDPTSYMAVEQFKQTIRSVFNRCDSFGCPTESTGLRVYTDGNPQRLPNVEASNPATQKGRFWRDIENPVPESANSKISRPGTIRELAEQVNPAESAQLLDQLKSRMLQIDPDTKESDLDGILDSMTLDLGAVAYIYKKDSKLILTSEAPPIFDRLFNKNVPGINDSRRKPAGSGIASVVSGWYQTIGNLVNPPKEGDIHLQLYTSYPDPSQVGQAEDRMHWQPGVGTTGDGGKGGSHNLGRLTFENKCGGKPSPGGGGVLSSAAGDFCQPD
ncbi:MAG: hypothetical protein K2W95_02850 [Candidatus Obscuribacterales bacterium]|nr:hypothetical protein [Candidatus Obscuribacterales bacterium]